MPICLCGEWVSRDFVRVLFPDSAESVEHCLKCANREGFAGGVGQ